MLPWNVTVRIFDPIADTGSGMSLRGFAANTNWPKGPSFRPAIVSFVWAQWYSGVTWRRTSAPGTYRTSLPTSEHVRFEGVKRTSLMRTLLSANDPKQTQ